MLLGLRPPSPTSLLVTGSQRAHAQVLMLTCGERPPLATFKARRPLVCACLSNV